MENMINRTYNISKADIKPFFPAKVFAINMTGTKGDWDAEIK